MQHTLASRSPVPGAPRALPRRNSSLHTSRTRIVASSTSISTHPDAIRRRQEAEERDRQRREERERQQQLKTSGLKWWQEPSQHFTSLASPAQFLELVESCKSLLIVKFFSEECYACKSLHPKMVKLAESYQGGVTFVKINGSLPAFKDLIQELGITGVPWFQFYRDGKCVSSMSVSLSPEKLAKFRLEVARLRA